MKMSRERKIARFDEKYRHKGGFEKFKDMVDNLSTLEEIGDHFGFSRQNTAGLYRSFFGEQYNKVQYKRKYKKAKEARIRSTDLDARLDEYNKLGKERSAKKTFYTKVVKDKAEKLGITAELDAKRNSAVRMILNGNSVNISGTNTETIYHIPRKRRPSIYYRFAITSRSVDFCIFVLDLGEEEGDERYTFYIIPFKEIENLTLITLKDRYSDYRRKRNGDPPSKYAKYRNAWHLLKD
ncbi:hypothetical protein KAH81_06635 [bacterium]|nr:hypothetical protein [bacterium]